MHATMNTNPTTAIDRRAVVQLTEDLTRLADQAERNGITIRLLPDGTHVASSGSDASRAYRVTTDSCECKGHCFTGKCQHRGLLLSELGLLDTGADDEPETVTVADLPDAMVSNIRASLECGMAPRSELEADAASLVANWIAEGETGLAQLQIQFISRFVSKQTPAERQQLITFRQAREDAMPHARALVAQIAAGVTAPQRYDVVLSEETRPAA